MNGSAGILTLGRSIDEGCGVNWMLFFGAGFLVKRRSMPC